MDGLPCLLPHWRPASGPGHPTLGILREGPAAAFTHRPPSRCRRRVAPPPTLTLARQTPEPGLCSAPGRLKSVSGSAPGAHLLPAALGLQRPLVHVQGGLRESQASQHLQCLQGGRLGRGNSCDVRGSYYIGCLRVLDEVQYSHLFSAFVLCGSWSSRGWGWCGGPSFTSTGGHPGPADVPAPLSPGTPRLLKCVPHRRASGLRWSASAALMAELSERQLSAGGLKRRPEERPLGRAFLGGFPLSPPRPGPRVASISGVVWPAPGQGLLEAQEEGPCGLRSWGPRCFSLLHGFSPKVAPVGWKRGSAGG